MDNWGTGVQAVEAALKLENHLEKLLEDLKKLASEKKETNVRGQLVLKSVLSYHFWVIICFWVLGPRQNIQPIPPPPLPRQNMKLFLGVDGTRKEKAPWKGGVPLNTR